MNRVRLKEIHHEAAMLKLKYKSYGLLTQVLPEHERNWKATSRVKLANAMAASVTTLTQPNTDCDNRVWQPFTLFFSVAMLWMTKSVRQCKAVWG